MSANTNSTLASAERPSLARAEPLSLAYLSDAELLTQTRSLVGRSNRLLAELLAHLGEVEARGIHRTRACASLYTYCIHELRFSEDEAFRRVAAARLIRRFPALLDAVASGELHLTGLLMLGPHVTEHNLVEVLARAKYRTKREIARLVRVLDPLPAVPALIEPLGPEPVRVVPPAPTWEQFVSSMNPVRALETRERPREWGVEEDEAANGRQAGQATEDPSGAKVTEMCARQVEATLAEPQELRASEMHAPARVDGEQCGELYAPQRYKVQFTTTEEYVKLVDEAKALLSHAAPRATLEDVQLRAMRAFVAALRKRKYGTNAAAVAAEIPCASNMAPPVYVPPQSDDDSRPISAAEPAISANECVTPASGTVVPLNESTPFVDPRWRGSKTANAPSSSNSAPSSSNSAPSSSSSAMPSSNLAMPPQPRRRGGDAAEQSRSSEPRRNESHATEPSPAPPESPRCATEQSPPPDPRRNESHATEPSPAPPEPRRHGSHAAQPASSPPEPRRCATEQSPAPDPRQRGRYIPAAVRRAVAARDGHRCTYADAAGNRCVETRRLEFHHVVPFAVSPSHDIANLTLRCAAHNALAAEADFGRTFVHRKRSAARHERFDDHEP
jgi:hypothetical protein